MKINYPWDSMKTGQGFSVPLSLTSIRSRAHLAGIKHNRRFKVKKMVSEGIYHVVRVRKNAA